MATARGWSSWPRSPIRLWSRPVVAQALDVSERDAPTPTAGLARALADRELLVVLDNCEHVLEAAAGLVATLACPVPAGAHPGYQQGTPGCSR